ncbi:MAG: DUF2264 domain-containing protein, partial [Verrucomicrobia bacterium]|nr:DUF2264 domain-containing protein [Verrucomicrobiota bacterium]
GRPCRLPKGEVVVEKTAPLDHSWGYFDWLRVAEEGLRPLSKLMKPGKAELPILGKPSSHGAQADRLESFSRPCLWAAHWLQAIPTTFPASAPESLSRQTIADWLRHGLLLGTEPNSPEYWGPTQDHHQHTVEMAALVLALEIGREFLWDPLSKKEKEQVAHWFSSVRGTKLHPNNHLFFGVLTLSFPKNRQTSDPGMARCPRIHGPRPRMVPRWIQSDSRLLQRLRFSLLWTLVGTSLRPERSHPHQTLAEFHPRISARLRPLLCRLRRKRPLRPLPHLPLQRRCPHRPGRALRMLSFTAGPIPPDLLQKSPLLLEPPHPAVPRPPKSGMGRRIHPYDRTLLLRRIPILGRQGPLRASSTPLRPLLAGDGTTPPQRGLRLHPPHLPSRAGDPRHRRRNRTPQCRDRHLPIQHRLWTLQVGQTFIPHRRWLRSPTTRRPLPLRFLTHRPDGGRHSPRPPSN